MYRYAKSAQQSAFRSEQPLSNHQIAEYAPSVLATEPHSSRGERYTFIPTIDVVEGLRREGFAPYEVRQTRVRQADRRAFTRHMVRLRHASSITSQGEVPEIVLLNSHDGTSSYQLLAGIFRFVCSNGLIAGDVMQDIRVRHSGNVVDDVIEGSFRVLDDVKHVEHRIDTYKSTELTMGEQQAFAEAALRLRYDEQAPIESRRLLLPRRWEDNKPDLWSTFNIVQENMLKGGVAGRSASGRRVSTREVGGVNENVKLNRALWTLADQLAQIKTGELQLAA